MKYFLHVVGFSSMPLMMMLSVIGFVLSFLSFVKYGICFFFFWSSFFLLFNMVIWMKDVMLEGVSGYHNVFVDKGFKIGFMIFIFTEVMFFFSIFWVFFDKFCYGGVWWPVESGMLDGWGLPLLGTVMLLSSGLTCTWAHSVVMNKNYKILMVLTFILGFGFLILQFYEYYNLMFDLSDGVYGSLFYFMTGFHGLHVMVGVILLGLSLVRFGVGYFSVENFFFFEGSAVYWHFVDVVWLLLFLLVYL